MVSLIIVILDEVTDLALKIIGQVVVFQYDTVFHGLMPSFDLALGLWVEWSTAHVIHFLFFLPIGQIARDVTRPVITKQACLCCAIAWSQRDAAKANSMVSVTPLARIVVQSFHQTIKRL